MILYQEELELKGTNNIKLYRTFLIYVLVFCLQLLTLPPGGQRLINAALKMTKKYSNNLKDVAVA